MAKGNMLLGQARGKVGDIVFSRSNGQQIIKSRTAQVKNPQTKAQMIQRIILNTVAQAYSAMAPICDHSFEGVAVGQDSMSYFMSKNAKLIRSLATENGLDNSIPMVVALGSNDLASNAYVISKGTLPEINLSEDSDYAGFKVSGNTYEDVISLNGLNRGDQLTFCILDGLNANGRGMMFHYARAILDPREVDGTEADLSVPFIVDGAINKANPRNENYGVSVSWNTTNTEVIFGAPTGRITFARAVIVSRLLSDGTWGRSNAQLMPGADGWVGMTLQDAYDNWLASGMDIESELYLNNAKKSAAISRGSTPTPTPGESYALTITKDTATSGATVKVSGSAIASGASVAAGATVAVHVPTLPSGTLTVAVNGTNVSMTEGTDGSDGTFTMPSQASSLYISFQGLNTGGGNGNNNDGNPSGLGG